ncbi:TPA: hypothetical protein ACQVKN_001044, partial [Serratia marcescens]
MWTSLFLIRNKTVDSSDDMIKNKNAKLNYAGGIQYCDPPPRLVLINYRQHFVIKVIGFKFAAMLA